MKACPDILKKLTPSQRHSLFGEVMSLLISSDLHCKYHISDFGMVFIPALNWNQFRIYKIKKEPIALITWAFMSKEVEKKYLSGDYSLRPKDWHSGDRAWVIDFLAPFGHAKEVMKDLKYKIFPNDVGRSVRILSEGKIKGVYEWRGGNVSKKEQKERLKPLASEDIFSKKKSVFNY
tara:strand:+ start:355 stop:885 length:531 start_codon:yes stop_codon:yes gene_type:complete